MQIQIWGSGDFLSTSILTHLPRTSNNTKNLQRGTRSRRGKERFMYNAIAPQLVYDVETAETLERIDTT